MKKSRTLIIIYLTRKSARWSKPIRSGECLTKNSRSTLTRGRTAIFYVYSSEWQ
nr:MAG TPA: hypothetical protein [Caudoviricetes sp.]